MKIILKNTNLVFQSGTFEVDDYIILPPTEVEGSVYISVITDKEGNVLWGRYPDNTETDIDLEDMTISGVSVQKIVDAVIDKYNLR